MNQIKEDWNTTAQTYEEFNNSPDSYSYNIEWPTIQNMLPGLEGKTVLDIGCGTGIFTFLLEQYKPSKLMGLDLSESMLEIARQKAAALHSKAIFTAGDAAYLNQYTQEKWDFIFSSTTTHYIENLNLFFENLSKVLSDNGTAILSIIHPVYSSMYPVDCGKAFPDDEDWKVNYLEKTMRAYIQPWIEYNDKYENRLSKSFHHLVSDYINAIINAGLKICEIQEPLPPEAWKTGCAARYESYMETPVYMIIKLTK